MPAGCSFAIDGSPQIEVVNYSAGRKWKQFDNCFADLCIVHLAGTLRIDMYANWLGNTDRISQLDFAAVRQTGSNNVFRNVPRHVSGATVDLSRILTAERTATMSPPTAVGIDDNLSSRQTHSRHVAHQRRNYRSD